MTTENSRYVLATFQRDNGRTSLREYLRLSRGQHHSVPPVLQHVRSPDQMAVTKSPILVFSLVAKNDTDTCARPDGYSAKISGNRHVKALLLGFNDSFEIEICMAFSVEIYIYGVEHNCAPVAICMELSGIAHATRRAGAVGDYW